MLAAVFSDTHGNVARMLQAVRETKPDAIFHLGDYERDVRILREEFPDVPVYNVCGNCDVSPEALLDEVVELDTVRVFLTHGHRYGVDYGDLSRLAYAARERDCRLALFGHTHRADRQEWLGVTLLNPGTAGKGYQLSYATVQTFPNGGFVCQIHKFDSGY